MRLLLDTHVLLWWWADRDRIATEAFTAIEAPENTVFASAASAWEISIKQALGRLTFPVDRFESQTAASGFAPLPVTASNGVAAGQLPRHHADPFDRMLIAQAQSEGLTLVTRDRWAGAYQVALLPA